MRDERLPVILEPCPGKIFIDIKNCAIDDRIAGGADLTG